MLRAPAHTAIRRAGLGFGRIPAGRRGSSLIAGCEEKCSMLPPARRGRGEADPDAAAPALEIETRRFQVRNKSFVCHGMYQYLAFEGVSIPIGGSGRCRAGAAQA
jgi:hypothetical protein